MGWSPSPANVVRAALGGVLMGLANLVPGISGGTMLLATGIYPAFVEAIAELTTLRIRFRSLLLLGSVGLAAATAILFLAGLTKQLVLEQRWIMYSLFIGLTLGGVPLVWRLARPHSPAVLGGAALGFLLMLMMVFAPGSGGAGSSANPILLFFSGLAGAGAMILPGISGGYLLLLLGQYVAILSAVDELRAGLQQLLAAAPDPAPMLEAGLALLGAVGPVLIPVGLGVLAGIVGVSNLLRWLLHHAEKATLGALLGLLLGAVVGLWPFQQGVPAEPTAPAESIEPEDWPLESFTPSPGQALGALGLIGLGLAATLAIDRLGAGADSGRKRDP